jgi:ion channel
MQPTLTAPEASSDLLQTWLGISGADLRAALNTLFEHKDSLQGAWLERIERRPMDAAFEFLAGAALAFYLAEKDANPKITSYIDAFYYIATCALVGYADVFAVTQTGRAVAASAILSHLAL